jgi:hypothetical protein
VKELAAIVSRGMLSEHSNPYSVSGWSRQKLQRLLADPEWCRELTDEGMKQFDELWDWYQLAAIEEIRHLRNGDLVKNHEQVLTWSLYQLWAFSKNEHNRERLPGSVEAASDLVNALLKYYDDSENDKATIKTAEELKDRLYDFRTILKRDVKRLNTYILEPKRGYSADTLMPASSSLIDRTLLPYLSEFTRYNLDDAGTALVFDRFTACGYHTVRAVEGTARRYYELVTARPTIKPNGDYLTLGQIANELDHVSAAYKAKRGQSGQLKLITSTLDALCEIYRNPLSHPEIVVLEEGDAIDVFNSGIDVITKMVRDAIKGGPHLSLAFSDHWPH